MENSYHHGHIIIIIIIVIAFLMKTITSSSNTYKTTDQDINYSFVYRFIYPTDIIPSILNSPAVFYISVQTISKFRFLYIKSL